MGNFNSDQHACPTRCEYKSDTNTLRVNGAQIIGWVCSVLPKFPAISMDHQNQAESGSIVKTQSPLPSKQRYCKLHVHLSMPKGTISGPEVEGNKCHTSPSAHGLYSYHRFA